MNWLKKSKKSGVPNQKEQKNVQNPSVRVYLEPIIGENIGKKCYFCGSVPTQVVMIADGETKQTDIFCCDKKLCERIAKKKAWEI